MIGQLRSKALPAVLAVLFAMLLSSAALLISKDNPLDAFGAMFGQLGKGTTLVDIVNSAAVYYLGGLAAAIGFQMNLFNIGIEGQYRVAAVVAAVVAGEINLPPILDVTAILVTGVVTGALYALIPALLKVYRGVSEVISTIMLNSISLGIVSLLLDRKYFGVITGNSLGTKQIPAAGQVPGISFGTGGTVFGLVLLAIVLGVAYWFMINRTRFGFELRATGESDTAAIAGGVNAKRMVLIAMLASGGLAGLVGLVELLGRDYSYTITSPAGYGFIGVSVALIGRNNPGGIAIGALLWAFLDKSSIALDNIGIPKEIVTIMQGIIVLSVVVAYELMRRYEAAAEQKQVGMQFLPKKLATNGAGK
jgi:simple sugar transport system permease protein